MDASVLLLLPPGQPTLCKSLSSIIRLCIHLFKYQVEVNTQSIMPFTPFTLHPMQISHLPTFHTPFYANAINMTNIMGSVPHMLSHSLLHGDDGTEPYTSLHHSLCRKQESTSERINQLTKEEDIIPNASLHCSKGNSFTRQLMPCRLANAMASSESVA